MRLLRNILCVILLCVCNGLQYGNVIQARTEYWHQRVTLFDKLPVYHQDIIFLGNSITDGGEFAELFQNENIKNRGITGDVISGVKERLYQVTEGNPRKIFLLIGINDISHDVSAKALAKEYESLVEAIVTQSPSTKVYLQSVMPINNDFGRYKNLKGKENVVAELNTLIKEIAEEKGLPFIDLTPILADKNGKLKKEYTNDGLHLTGEGYTVWTNHLRPFVDE